MLQTSFFKFFLTPYYSPSWDETSCSTSHCNHLNFLSNEWTKLFWAARPKKYDSIKFSFFFTFSIIFGSTRHLKWLVEQDGLIPTRRVIRCQENLHFWGLRHFGKVKDLKSKINIGSSVQIWIWIHFRIGLELKYITSGRISEPIDFIEVENPDEGCTSELKKMIILNFFWKIDFLRSEGFIFTFSIIFGFTRHLKWLVEQDGLIPTRRVIRCSGKSSGGGAATYR